MGASEKVTMKLEHEAEGHRGETAHIHLTPPMRPDNCGEQRSMVAVEALRSWPEAKHMFDGESEHSAGLEVSLVSL